MIRDFKLEDKNELIKLVKQDFLITEEEISECFDAKNYQIIVFDNGEKIQGFSCVKPWNNKKKADVLVYVVPNERRKGIGTLLYTQIMKQKYTLNFTFIVTQFRIGKEDVTPFYKSLGYQKWYGVHDLLYNGSAQPKSELKIIAYEDRYFEQYAEGLRSSFYEMRKAHDFQPHICCELSDEKRSEFLKNKEKIFLLLNNEKLIASAMVTNNGLLDDIFVTPFYQGKGYGKIITQFAINKAISQGANRIELNVVEWNEKALKLYQSLGFSKIQTTHYYKLVKTEI
ncbi:GNAT family N-acetyltransferase [Vibrio cholerae]